MFTIGAKVKTSNKDPWTKKIIGDLTGTVLSVSKDSYKTVVKVRVEISNNFKPGIILSFYENHLELIKNTIDPTSIYQYCIKCEVLTSNKSNLCCDHK